jgi:gliding motility-associated-like protein
MHPNHIFDSAGTYLVTLVATDAKGCIDSVTKPIIINKEFYIYIPNSFIPDQDRINDYFSGSFIGVMAVEVFIFNRWGELIFESNDLNFRWDGTYRGQKVQLGTYTWLIKYKRKPGMTEVITGHVNVLK